MTDTMKIAIIGRPNVGKSTLFNRLTGTKHAIVDDQPGVTRDRRQGAGKLADLRFDLFDTPGLEDDVTAKDLIPVMQEQCKVALAIADIAFFVIDGKQGLTQADRLLAGWIRKLHNKIFLLVNKAEGRIDDALLSEVYSLGFGEPILVSAEHGVGLGDLYDRLIEVFPNPCDDDGFDDDDQKDDADSDADAEMPLMQMAIVGRPNVGKSTLINKILGQTRLLTGDRPGITRDAIAVDHIYKGQKLKLIDTAGMRKRGRIDDRVEGLAVRDTLRAVTFAHVVVLVVDAQNPLERQDIAIARHAEEEGRAIIIAVNKIDLISDLEKLRKQINDKLSIALPTITGVPIVFMSAEKEKNITSIFDAAFKIYELWNKRFSTAKLNRWLEEVVSYHPLPLIQGRRLRIKYMTQIKTRPPTFAIFVNKPGDLPETYIRYLTNRLRQDFKMPGVPLRFYLRGGDKNPYVNKK